MGLSQSKEEDWGSDEWKPEGLSHVGQAVYDKLRTVHAKHHHTMWNTTRSAMVGSLQQTPSAASFTDEQYSKTLSVERHSDWFVEKMFDLMSKTTKWCDVMSLAPPVECEQDGKEDGYFLKKMKTALENIAKNAKGKKEPVIVRMMFGFGYGEFKTLAIDCNYWRKILTEELPEDANIQLWVGAWRYGMSWNHAKIIAVDGKYVHTGGHNLWSETYLQQKPVHDISIEMEGHAAHDAHLFANTQWEWIESRQNTYWGRIWANFPDWIPVIAMSRLNISEWPVEGATVESAPVFAPSYRRSIVDEYEPPKDAVPVISVGRQAALIDVARPADDAFVAMFDSATKIIRMSLQDLGPVAPFFGWPYDYFDAMSKAMWERGVVIQIVLSNLKGNSYSHGFTIAEIQAKIFKRMNKIFTEVTKDEFQKKIVCKKLLISFIRHKHGNTYYQEEDEKKIEVSNHSKFIIVDDVCSYTGSQNLYLCDLAEWGVIIDDVNVTMKMMKDYWNPMWKASYNTCDCKVGDVMECINNDTDNEEVYNLYSFDGKKKMEQAVMAMIKAEAPRNTRQN